MVEAARAGELRRAAEGPQEVLAPKPGRTALVQAKAKAMALLAMPRAADAAGPLPLEPERPAPKAQSGPPGEGGAGGGRCSCQGRGVCVPPGDAGPEGFPGGPAAANQDSPVVVQPYVPSAKGAAKSTFTNLLVKNLRDGVTQALLMEKFETFGTVTSAELRVDQRGRPFAFVNYDSRRHAEECVQQWHGAFVDDLSMAVEGLYVQSAHSRRKQWIRRQQRRLHCSARCALVCIVPVVRNELQCMLHGQALPALWAVLLDDRTSTFFVLWCTTLLAVLLHYAVAQ
eukprot:TRINITY_DN85_c0_g2_i3.p2 TRINITY_DN85_c0_g2~~TRINITY_DN85_c0_g2_i3.p2  ORF type:complete len:285 (+),score=77.28 TRINITY_DN85_c0_g2_i3:64-918(+)